MDVTELPETIDEFDGREGCPDCGLDVRPVALPFGSPEGGVTGLVDDMLDADSHEGYFIVCPKCHYVFDRKEAGEYHPY